MNIKDDIRPVASLSKLVDSYQSSGRYVFVRNEATSMLKMSNEAFRKAISRLVAKQRLAMPRRGFYVIVPLEYKSAGAPPPSWFIDKLMKFHGCSYYVGLLSAAAIHGATHQQVQEFQVVTNVQLRPTSVGRARIRFFTKHDAKRTPTVEIKTETGAMRVSTPEATAIDLVQYMKSAGHLSNIATILSELAERMDAKRLIAMAPSVSEAPILQRLGYLLDQVGAENISAPLANWLSKQHLVSIALRPDRPTKRSQTDKRWKVRVNERVEIDNI